MAGPETKQKLLDYLDRRVFEPIMDIDPASVDPGERTVFDLLQGQLEQVRQGLHNARSAEEVAETFDRIWLSDQAVAARRGLARIGHPLPETVRSGFQALARECGVDSRPEGLKLLAGDPDLERRIRARAQALWQDDGSPAGREDEYYERARELEGIADNPDAGLLANPMTEADRRPSPEVPIEPPEAVENQADFPGRLTDQGERAPAPTRDAWKNAT